MKQLGKGLAYILAALIIMILFWLLFGQEARAQTSDSVVVFLRCEPRKSPTKTQLDSLLDWAKSVYVEGGKFKVVGFASTRDHDRRDETFARNRKEAGKKVISNGFPVVDGGVFGGPGYYRGLKVVFLPPTVDTTARQTAVSALSKADIAVSRALEKKTTDTFLELGVSYVYTPETENIAVPVIGVIFQYKKLEIAARGGLLPKVYENTDQRLFHGEFLTGLDFGWIAVAGKLGGVVITPKNVTTRDVMTMYGGIEVKRILLGKLYAKGAFVLASTRKYRPELQRFKTDNKLRGRFTLTLSAEL